MQDEAVSPCLHFFSVRARSQIPRLHVDEALSQYRANRQPLLSIAILGSSKSRQKAIKYACRLSDSPFSLQDQNSLFIVIYVVYGRYYTRITETNQGHVQLYQAAPWQFVFEDFALAHGRVPFLYRLCELAVRHWDYSG